MRAPANDSSSPGSEARNHGLNILFATRPLNVNTQMLLVYVCVSGDLFRNDTINY